MSEDFIYGEPIETREGTYKDGYVRAILQTKDLIDILQTRIDKAIDYIEHKANIKEYFMVNGKEYTELLGILKGSDSND